ncbi:hypothetical protein BpHYR1_053685 [Brachionus plicatilis]|uniref:Uncharacterized protein n=1 Tax=Brachionus plicatilis TaxID=10195 RepID=A0A3M7SGM7_BRAPC|nr:hypothetical protein BpHYR1_053685 [Brachionus plicatilis]
MHVLSIQFSLFIPIRTELTEKIISSKLYLFKIILNLLEILRTYTRAVLQLKISHLEVEILLHKNGCFLDEE